MKKKEKPNNIKIAEAILEQYKSTTVGEMQDALKETFGPMFEAMLKSKFIGDRDGSFEPKIVLKRKKDILGLWIYDTESTHVWMQIFDEIKSRGVEDIMFISMDGVSGLEE